MEDTELAARSIRGFGAMIALLGRWGVGLEAVIDRPDAIGARIAAQTQNPWFDAVVVPLGAAPPPDDPTLPGCVWTVAESVPGRVEEPTIATPCLGLELGADAGPLAVDAPEQSPTLAEVGLINELAYEQPGALAHLLSPIRDDRLRAHGVRDGGRLVCVALGLTLGDDLSIQYVATQASHRRRGLASQLLTRMLHQARADGLQTATLQASPAGLSVYERLGFRQVATLRGFVRPEGS